MTNTTAYFDKVTLLGPPPDGGSYTTETSDPAVQYLVSAGYTVSRVWTVKVNSDGTRESLVIA